MSLFIGTAGWTVPKQHAALFPIPLDGGDVSHLERYATRLRCVEVNSSFYRPHRRTTWERWAETTPADFLFAVKAPRSVTHTAELVNSGDALPKFFASIRGLGDKLGPVLIQLPPKLSFREDVVMEFFTNLRRLHSGAVALEPRHASWFSAPVDQLLRSFEIARVAADPPKGSELAAHPGGWSRLQYWRLHGTPHTYYSEYDEHWLERFLKMHHLLEVRSSEQETWIIFDNTALGHATPNAIWLEHAISSGSLQTSPQLAGSQ